MFVMRLMLVLVAALIGALLTTCVDEEAPREFPTEAAGQTDTTSLSAERALTSGKRDSISGYEDYELAQPIDKEVLARFVGSQRDKSQPEVQVYDLKEDCPDGHNLWLKNTTLVLRDGLLKAVFVDYDPPPELRRQPEEAWDFVESLRQAIMGQYDSQLVAKDKFYQSAESPGAKSWMGVLLLKDECGRELVLIWTGTEVRISCWEEEFMREVKEDTHADLQRKLPSFPPTPSL
jgi:hypothetical protein